MIYEEKRQALLDYFDQKAEKDIVLAFSGGVDSSLLLKIACEAVRKTGRTVFAITAHTELHPMKDLQISQQLANEYGATHLVVNVDELNEAGIAQNPVNRCYLCKKCIFNKVMKKAEELKAGCVLDGTNADDLLVYRPGIQALKELGIESPLALCGFTKAEVRQLAAELGISVANRPSTPCMSTRFPYGTTLSYELMHKLDAAEEWLRNKGLHNVRLRVHGDIIRMEVDKEAMHQVIDLREEIITELKKLGIDYITLDLEGFRSGSMDLHVQQ